jgi:outer membrane biosynthesis protein TonB
LSSLPSKDTVLTVLLVNMKKSLSSILVALLVTSSLAFLPNAPLALHKNLLSQQTQVVSQKQRTRDVSRHYSLLYSGAESDIGSFISAIIPLAILATAIALPIIESEAKDAEPATSSNPAPAPAAAVVAEKEPEPAPAAPEPEPAPAPPPAPAVATVTKPATTGEEISRLRKEVAKTKQEQVAAQERLDAAAKKAQEEAAREEVTKVEEWTDVEESTEDIGPGRKAIRILKKLVAPWRKWKNIKA